MHAFAVYVGVFPFRIAIANHPQMDKDTKCTFVTSISQAEKSMRLLGSALTERRDQFDPDGRSLIEELQAANPFAAMTSFMISASLFVATQSAMVMALAVFFQLAPRIYFSFFGGLLVDRINVLTAIRFSNFAEASAHSPRCWQLH
ncbi:MAG: hypothetical protein ABJO27_01170 [Pseudoruegeria sp.]